MRTSFPQVLSWTWELNMAGEQKLNITIQISVFGLQTVYLLC